VNVTFTTHDPPTATGAARHVLDETAKSVPAIVRPLMLSGPLPELDTVTACEADVVFTVRAANARPAAADGAVLTAGAVAAATVTV
jgi:hypothetical protein